MHGNRHLVLRHPRFHRHRCHSPGSKILISHPRNTECVGGKYLNQSKDTQSYRSNSSTKPIGQVIRSYNKPLHISIV